MAIADDGPSFQTYLKSFASSHLFAYQSSLCFESYNPSWSTLSLFVMKMDMRSV